MVPNTDPHKVFGRLGIRNMFFFSQFGIQFMTILAGGTQEARCALSTGLGSVKRTGAL